MFGDVYGTDMTAFAASRLGRRPKRLKRLSFSEAESSKPAASLKPLMIAPQPPQLGLLPLSMAELEVTTLTEFFVFVDVRKYCF